MTAKRVTNETPETSAAAQEAIKTPQKITSQGKNYNKLRNDDPLNVNQWFLTSKVAKINYSTGEPHITFLTTCNQSLRGDPE